MTPEEKARVKIDQMFEEAGWQVVYRDFYSPTITAAAIREGLLNGNREADYFLFINGKAIGVLEAKRAKVDVTSTKVCEQTYMYARGVPDCYQVEKPLAFDPRGRVALTPSGEIVLTLLGEIKMRWCVKLTLHILPLFLVKKGQEFHHGGNGLSFTKASFV